jgi:hypothetical protein
MKKLCPICLLLYSPAGFAMHVKQHVRAGELVRREVVTAEAGNIARNAWTRHFVYEKPNKKG